MVIRVKPTKVDVSVARAIARHTSPPVEEVAQIVTWGADEKILCGLAAGWWLLCRGATSDRRLASDHLLLTTLAVSAVPHLLKAVFDQRRPDRVELEAHLHGTPFSGNANDAFPSGHALHIGALASAATVLRPAQRNAVWAVGAGLVLTRIVLLAHWVSDVAAGLLLGSCIERSLRPLTGFGGSRHGDKRQAP